MIDIKQIFNNNEKLSAIDCVTATIPDWFGENTTNEEIQAHVGTVAESPFFVAVDNDDVLGFIALKLHNKQTAELSVMAVSGKSHGQGIGKKLIARCEQYCIEHNISYFTVKTVAESDGNEVYKSTRKFYENLGFIPIEIFPDFWGEGLPCVYSIKRLEK